MIFCTHWPKPKEKEINYCWFLNRKQEHNRVRCLWRGETKCQGQEGHWEQLSVLQRWWSGESREKMDIPSDNETIPTDSTKGQVWRGKITQKTTLGGPAACRHYLLSAFSWHALTVLEQSWSNAKQLSLCQTENASHLYTGKGRSPWKCFIFSAKIWLKCCLKLCLSRLFHLQHGPTREVPHLQLA